MKTDIDILKASLKRWTLILGVLQIMVGCLVGFIPPSARVVVSRYCDGARRVHRQRRLNGGIRLPGQGTPPESGGIKGVVRDAANWLLDERSGGRCSGLHRRFVEAHANDQ